METGGDRGGDRVMFQVMGAGQTLFGRAGETFFVPRGFMYHALATFFVSDNFQSLALYYSRLPCIHLQLYYNCPVLIYNHITIALYSFTMILQLYYNSPVFVYNHITIVLQFPCIHLQSYYNCITIFTQSYYNIPMYYYNIVIKGCGIIHIAYRVTALPL